MPKKKPNQTQNKMAYTCAANSFATEGTAPTAHGEKPTPKLQPPAWPESDLLGHSNQSCSRPKAALAFSAPSKSVPKTRSKGRVAPHRAIPPLGLPGTCSARGLWDVANRPGPGFKDKVPLPDIAHKLLWCAGLCVEHQSHKYLQKPLGGCPRPRASAPALTLSPVPGRAQHGHCWARKVTGKKIMRIYPAFLNTTSPTCTQHRPPW